MNQQGKSSEGSRTGKYDKIESGIKSIERFLIILSVLIVFLLIGWKMGGEYGDVIILVCGGLIAVLVMVEILLIERHRHRR
jgi:hypothetical protein